MFVIFNRASTIGIWDSQGESQHNNQVGEDLNMPTLVVGTGSMFLERIVMSRSMLVSSVRQFRVKALFGKTIGGCVIQTTPHGRTTLSKTWRPGCTRQSLYMDQF